MADGVVEYILRLTDKTKAGTRSAVQGSQQLENQTKQTTQAVDKLGDESAQTSRQLDRMGKQSRGTSTGLAGLSRGLGGALSSVSSLAGGVKMIAALSSVFRDVRFMPTGGVNVDNLAEHLAVPSVIACGGSWLTPSSAIKAGDFVAITKLAEEAITIATKTKANL